MPSDDECDASAAQHRGLSYWPCLAGVRALTPLRKLRGPCMIRTALTQLPPGEGGREWRRSVARAAENVLEGRLPALMEAGAEDGRPLRCSGPTLPCGPPSDAKKRSCVRRCVPKGSLRGPKR